MIGKRRPFARKAAFFCPAGDKTLRPSAFFSRSFLARPLPEPERSAVHGAESPCFMPSRIRQRTPEQEPSIKRRARVSAMNGGLFPARRRAPRALSAPPCGFPRDSRRRIFPLRLLPGSLRGYFSPQVPAAVLLPPRLPPRLPAPARRFLRPIAACSLCPASPGSVPVPARLLAAGNASGAFFCSSKTQTQLRSPEPGFVSFPDLRFCFPVIFHHSIDFITKERNIIRRIATHSLLHAAHMSTKNTMQSSHMIHHDAV